MLANVVTLEDLEQLKLSMIEEMKKFYFQKHPQPTIKKWLKSHEVIKALTISPGTLQNLRTNGTLPYTKIGGVIYYEATDVEKMLVDHKRVDKRHPFSLEKRSLN